MADDPVGEATPTASPSREASPAFDAVMRKYLSRGKAGIDDLRRELNRPRPSTVVLRFAEDLYDIIQGEVVVPTSRINDEIDQRELEAISSGIDDFRPPKFDDPGAYDAVVDMWDTLGLSIDDGQIVTEGSRNRRGRFSSLLPVADPEDALKTWWSWPLFAAAFVGAIGTYIFYSIAAPIHAGWGRTTLLSCALLCFIALGIGAGGLMLRRRVYVDPDAFASKPKKKKRS